MIDRRRLAMLALLVCAGCQQETSEAPQDQAERAALTGATLDSALTAIGDSAATALTTTLMGRVRAEVERAGPAAAVSFCSEQALPLTIAVEDSLASGLALKRTSQRVRNPANAPDSLERAALAHFDSAIARGTMPASFIQTTGQGWNYYKPIMVAPLCTTCHGATADIDRDVRRVLAERYPDDQATGYAPGDFRGVVRVSIPASRVVATGTDRRE